MASNPLPGAAGIGDLITMLVGKKVKAAPTAPLAIAAVRGVATYVDAAGNLAFVALADMAFVGGVGAALTMIPPAVVAEAVKSGKPGSNLLENAFEVMNILSSLYNDAEGKGAHVKIKTLVIAPPLAPELVPLVAKPVARLDLEVQIPGYANGKLTLMALKVAA